MSASASARASSGARPLFAAMSAAYSWRAASTDASYSSDLTGRSAMPTEDWLGDAPMEVVSG